MYGHSCCFFFFFQAEDGIRDYKVTGVQTCALPIWGAWIVVLFALLLWWRPYVWEGLAVMLANVVMGVIAVPFWRRLAPYQQNRLLAFLNPEVDPRATGWHVIQSKIAIEIGRAHV